MRAHCECIVDFNGMIHIAELEDYQRTVQAETWRVLNEMCDKYRNRKLRVAYFNSTPQGGGGNSLSFFYISSFLTMIFYFY